MEDRSLDEFLNDSGDEDGPTSEDDGPTSEDRETGDATRTEEADDEGPVDETDGVRAETDGVRAETDDGGRIRPASATAAWRPGGGECVDCGAVVRRRWRGVDGLVCHECKEWGA